MAVAADTEAVFAALCTADPDVMDRDDLATYVKQVATIRGVV